MDLPDIPVTYVSSAFVGVLLLIYLWRLRRNPKYPPCPLRPWPIVGNLLQLSREPLGQMAEFRKQCGDIYSIYMAHVHLIVLNGSGVVKEAFSTISDNFVDKATIFMDIATVGPNKGIATANGPVWKENRNFSTAVLRNFGLGRNILAEKIQEEVSHLIKRIESLNGEPNDIQIFTTISVSNIMCSLIVGQRFDYDDEQFQRMQEILKFNMSKLQGTGILNYFPWLRHLPGDVFGSKIIEKNFHEFFDIFVRFHMKENQNVVGEPGNYIAAYLQEIKKKEKTKEKYYMDTPNMLRAILDLFIAGTETTASTLGFFFLYMVNYPDVQEKIMKEISEVVGCDRTANLQDKPKLVYLAATIMEVQRLAALVPLSIPRLTKQDVNIGGYLVPKGSQIMLNYESVLKDPVAWGNDAEKFRPERFIADDGSLKNTPEAWIPFSIGKRNCMGESMARMELFIFTTNILQRFKILPADPESLPSTKAVFGLTHAPPPYEIRFVSRGSLS